MAYNDANDPGNSSEYHTGKPCTEPGCNEPAGTYWGPHQCFKHNVERLDRIDASLNRMVEEFEGNK